MLVEGSFEGDQAGRQKWIKGEVQIAAFLDAFRGAKEKYFVLDDRSAEIDGGIPSVEEGGAAGSSRNVVGVKNRVAEKDRCAAMPLVGSAASHDVDDAA